MFDGVVGVVGVFVVIGLILQVGDWIWVEDWFVVDVVLVELVCGIFDVGGGELDGVGEGVEFDGVFVCSVVGYF